MILEIAVAIGYCLGLGAWLIFDKDRHPNMRWVAVVWAALVSMPFLLPNYIPRNWILLAMFVGPIQMSLVVAFTLRAEHAAFKRRERSKKEMAERKRKANKPFIPWTSPKNIDDEIPRDFVNELLRKTTNKNDMRERTDALDRMMGRQKSKPSEPAQNDPYARRVAFAQQVRSASMPRLSEYVPELETDDRKKRKLFSLYYATLKDLEAQGSDLWIKAQHYLSPLFYDELDFIGVNRALIRSTHPDSGDERFSYTERETLSQALIAHIQELKGKPKLKKDR